MKTFIFTIAFSTLTFSSFAGAETCSAKMKKIIAQKNSPSYLNGDYSGGFGGGISIDVSVLAKPFLRLRAKNATKALAILTDAGKEGGGPATKELWDKLNGKHHHYAEKISYEQFVKAIHSSDLKGTDCVDDEILKKVDFKAIAVDENINCESANKNKPVLNLKKFCDESKKQLDNAPKDEFTFPSDGYNGDD